MSDLTPAPVATRPIDAEVDLPASKSLTNRELVLAACADGPGVVANALRSRDTELMARALAALGATIDTSGPDWSVVPGRAVGDTTVDCGLAGTVMRFVPPVAALGEGAVRFDGDPQARKRPMAEMLAALRDLGVTVDGDRLPFTVRGSGSVAGGTVNVDASASSQFVSALLLAGSQFDSGLEVRHTGDSLPSAPHIEMTLECLRQRRVAAIGVGADRWRVEPGPIAARDVVIEPDLSNAAPFLMLAMTSGGRVSVPGWPVRTTQAGDRLRDLLAAMGAEVTLDQSGLSIVGGEAITGLDADLRDVGELVPTLAALCVLAETPSRLRGIGHIRGHETDRLAALTRELSGLGADVTELPDGLEIRPAALHGGVFHTWEDHRMAHAAVIVGSRVPGVEVENIATTAKTFPGFETVWAGLFDA